MSYIASSELIINSDGSIYHLDLKPGELAPIIITVGDQDRVPMVSSRFDRINVKRQHREFVTHTGTYRGLPISVLSTGIGTDNIDIAINETDAIFNIDFEARQVKDVIQPLTFIRIGTSGTMRESIPVDSMIISEAAVGLDNLMHHYNQPEVPEFWQGFRNAFELSWKQTKLKSVPYLSIVEPDQIASVPDEFIRGVTVTAPGFYAPQGRKLRASSDVSFLKDVILPFEYEGRKFTNFEMETAAIYGMARCLGHRGLSFNTILANRTRGTFSTDGKAAVNNLIDRVLAWIVTTHG